ncbi:MAG: ASKHA domain-containing protein [Oscillospiraceae bacterium]|nr:ASKHA domain-containing protein [Oscillospiraceae bacterium]
MPVVTLIREDFRREVEAPVGQPLIDLLRKEVPSFDFPCAGNHTCGKCGVQIEGDYTCREVPAGGGKHLACCTEILGDCSVYLPAARGQQIVFGAGRTASGHRPLYSGSYGAAVDIGTTTVAACLFRRGEDRPAAVRGEMNMQRAFGSDVLARIVYCGQNTVAPLQELICRQIGQMLLDMCREAGIGREEVGGGCITGNTAMLHTLTGLDPHGISVAPFVPESLFGGRSCLALGEFGRMECYLPPCVSAYVGGDISCSILASGVMERERTAMVIDVGTNGEIALYHQGKLTCCSAAAGPAFEGACISCGLPACGGAIDRVWGEHGELRYTVIGGTAAEGICGSGLIDAVCWARRLDMLDKRGRPDGMELPIGGSGISLTRRDIGELLLAKAAIRAGIDTLLYTCRIEAESVEQVVLCGGFGSRLDTDSAVGIGLLPPCFQNRTASIGNAAISGAGMVLQDQTCIRALERIAALSNTVELSGNPYFHKQYIKSMYLPEIDRDSQRG